MRDGRKKRSALLVLGCSLLVWALQMAGFAPLQDLEWYFYDLRIRLGRKTAIPEELVFIGIDRSDYREFISPEEAAASPELQTLLSPYPWPRSLWGDLINRLTAAGARVVVLDILFASPGTGDDHLRSAVEKSGGRTILVSAFTETHGDAGTSISLVLPSQTIVPQDSFSPRPAVGFANVWPENDGVVRRARLKLATDQWLAGGNPVAAPESSREIIHSLASRVFQCIGRPQAPPTELEPLLFRYAAPPGRAFHPHPLYQIFIPSFWRELYSEGAFFKDKIVVVGPAANFFHDQHLTPFPASAGLMLGPELQMNILAAGLGREWIRESQPLCNAILVLAAGLVVWALFILFSRLRGRLILLLFAAAVYLLFSQLLFDRANFAVQTAAPMLTLALAGASSFVYDFLLERLEKTRIRRTLERYVSRNVVRELLDNPKLYFDALGGVRKPVCILFADLRGFTAWSEKVNSIELVRQLNEYFTGMVEHVLSTDGTLDKFIGDALMAVWGNIHSLSPNTDATAAVEAALRMRATLRQLNAQWRSAGKPELSFGVGLHHGEVIVGNIGYRGRSGERMEFTVIGDAVNLASRVEGLTKIYREDLLVTDSIKGLVEKQFVFRPVDLVAVQGKKVPVEIFAVLGRADEPLASPIEELLLQHAEGIQAYRAREFSRAEFCFGQALRLDPTDFLARLHLERTRQCLAQPPDQGWTPAVALDSK